MKQFITVVLVLFILCCPNPASAAEFTDLIDYQMWAEYVGYSQGLLVPQGIAGINQDYFHSFPGSPGYTSGKIVIGDSRSCQLGIYQNRMGSEDFAAFAVWGGHYVNGSGTPALTWQILSEIEQCFQEQIRTNGKSIVFFFATVNDYNYFGNNAGVG